MQFRHDLGNGLGFGMQRPPDNPHLPVVPPFRGGFPIDYGPRVDDWRQGMSSPASRTSTCYNTSKQEEQDDGPPSKHLWVGNVSQEITDPVLKEKFAQYGDVDNVTVYPSRNYAFVNFRNQVDAVNAKNRLQGVYLGGLAMRIEFAKGRTTKADSTKGREAHNETMEGVVSNKAMQSRHLWIGGLGAHTMKEQLEMELRKFGPIEEFKILRDRHCAFVDFIRLDDAIAALEGLHRKRVGNDELRVEYGRSHSAKRKQEGRGDDRSSTPRDNWVAPDEYTGFHDAPQKGGDPMQLGASGKGDRDGGPSEVLWIGFPLTTKIEEQNLLSAFSPFGEIERVKTFPGRTYAFVQFKCKEDATRAKENLDGKLFSDPRVHIRFSKSEIGPMENPRPENPNVPPSPWWMEEPGYPAAEMMGAAGALGLRGGGIHSPGRDPHFGSPGRICNNNNNNNNMRISGLRPEYRPDSLMSGIGMTPPHGGGDARNAEVAYVIARKPVRENGGGMDDVDYLQSILGGRPESRSSYDDTWDLPDEENMYRDPKRLRSYGGGVKRPSFYEPQQFGGYDIGGGAYARGAGKVGDGYGGPPRVSGMEKYEYGLRPRATCGGGLAGTDGPLLPVDGMRSSASAHGLIHSLHTTTLLNGNKHDTLYAGLDNGGVPSGGWQWHGTIAKGGTPVCRARCLPLGKTFDLTIPDVVNCTARTDLDMLAKHVFQAGEYGIVFFVPEGDPDVPPYQDFMHYLGEKHRAGVAKLADGTTLFLVPPSEFLERVLKLPGQNCLFGVVLRFKGSASSLHPPPPQLEQGRSLLQQPPRMHRAPSAPQEFGSAHLSLLLGQQQPPPPPPQAGQSKNGSNSVPNSSDPPLTSFQLASIAGLPGGLTSEFIASLTALLPHQAPAPPGGATSGTAPSQLPSGGGIYGLCCPAPGSAAVARAPPPSAPPPSQQTDQCRNSAQSSVPPPPPPPSQGWPTGPQQCQQEQQPLGLTDHMQSSNQGSNVFMQQPTNLQQQQQQGVQGIMGIASSSTGGNSSGVAPSEPTKIQHQQQQHGFAGGANGQQILRPPPGAAPPLPSDQLTQLTALFTRPQQPAQQQAAAQLLHHHFQHQNQLPPPPPPSSSSSKQSSASLLHLPPPLLQSQQSTNPVQPPPQYPSQPLPQSLPPLLQPPLQQANFLQQPPQPQQQQQPQSQPPLEYAHISHSQWCPSPASHSQSQSLHHLAPQQQSLHSCMQQQQKQAPPTQSQGGSWESAASKGENAPGAQGTGQNQSVDVEPVAQQKRFEATLQLAAALLQQMQQQQQQGKSQAGAEQQQQ